MMFADDNCDIYHQTKAIINFLCDCCITGIYDSTQILKIVINLSKIKYHISYSIHFDISHSYS